jgi:hypothetical protein
MGSIVYLNGGGEFEGRSVRQFLGERAEEGEGAAGVDSADVHPKVGEAVIDGQGEGDQYCG